MGDKKTSDLTTEAKIKQAARKIFHEKGYAATRTRDIAEEAGVNLALLNYYFRSKEKLFDIIMLETMSNFMRTVKTILADESSSLEQKIELYAVTYIDFLIKEENIPIFMLSEIRNNPKKLLDKIPLKELLENSAFIKQYQEAVAQGKITEPNVRHFFINLLSLVIFPFIGRPFLQEIHGLNDEQYFSLIEERKQLIPVWIKTMMITT